MTNRVRVVSGGVQIKVKIQPRASKNQISGWIDGMLKIRLTAPPVDGEANAACISFLAELLGLPKLAVRIISGQTSRNKTIEIKGISDAQFEQLIFNQSAVSKT